MRFLVIPAVDVLAGRLARLTAEGAVPVDAFGGDPVAAARSFVEAGATWIHVVDMDLALAGEFRSLDVVGAIAGVGARVQASGGVRSEAEIDAAMSAGASRVVLGSASLVDRAGAAELVARHGEALAVGLEADGATIRPRGMVGVELPLWETLEWLAGLPVARYLHTDVGRAGGLEGPDLDGAWALATSTRRPVIAAGGIRNVEDLRALAALGEGVEGAVVGRALYEGLDLREALSAVA
ncbi:MAG: HisA/HisF-related TIM barrel protein [Actinomycetota bacterium]